MLDNARLARFVDQRWGDSIVPTLIEYIKIPNKSPAFDPDWAAHGYLEEAVRLFERVDHRWIALQQDVPIEAIQIHRSDQWPFVRLRGFAFNKRRQNNGVVEVQRPFILRLDLPKPDDHLLEPGNHRVDGLAGGGAARERIGLWKKVALRGLCFVIKSMNNFHRGIRGIRKIFGATEPLLLPFLGDVLGC